MRFGHLVCFLMFMAVQNKDSAECVIRSVQTYPSNVPVMTTGGLIPILNSKRSPLLE